VPEIKLIKNVLDANEAVADENRNRLDERGILAVNITSAPGSGKTTLLEKTIPALGDKRPSAVIVGDLQTTRDAERLSDLAVQVAQINTEGGCHLSAAMIGKALDALDLDTISVVFIENVGNMVCPAGFDLGEHARVAMVSVPEGDDKVAKYPTLFQPADAIIVNKIDLADVLECDLGRIRSDLDKLNTHAPRFEMAAKKEVGLDGWLAWLEDRSKAF
jgi:hydrogenase nickel incorporation protein HypB